MAHDPALDADSGLWPEREAKLPARQTTPLAKTDTEITNPAMSARERLARMISRGLGHNDSEGMDWERYVSAADLILRHARVAFEK